jgi:hypothetical protein
MSGRAKARPSFATVTSFSDELVAERLGVTVRTLACWTRHRGFPPAAKRSKGRAKGSKGRRSYKFAAVLAWERKAAARGRRRQAQEAAAAERGQP